MEKYYENLNKIYENVDQVILSNRETNKEIIKTQKEAQKFYDDNENKFKIVSIPDSLKLTSTLDKKREITKLKNLLAQSLLKQGSE